MLFKKESDSDAYTPEKLLRNLVWLVTGIFIAGLVVGTLFHLYVHKNQVGLLAMIVPVILPFVIGVSQYYRHLKQALGASRK